jgi:hypothetical protein
VVYPLREVLFLVVCGTIANSNHDEHIVDWGEAHLEFLRHFSKIHHGIPWVEWLRMLFNRVDPDLFPACLRAWAAECWLEHSDQVASTAKRPAAAMTARPSAAAAADVGLRNPLPPGPRARSGGRAVQ